MLVSIYNCLLPVLLASKNVEDLPTTISAVSESSIKTSEAAKMKGTALQSSAQLQPRLQSCPGVQGHFLGEERGPVPMAVCGGSPVCALGLCAGFASLQLLPGTPGECPSSEHRCQKAKVTSVRGNCPSCGVMAQLPVICISVPSTMAGQNCTDRGVHYCLPAYSLEQSTSGFEPFCYY
ncbi:hypothetical protein EK904_001509 [Melospiza melodia maxima]|nr:hypothetical protein EK904_001509 [Melospiza melodia maxima]